MEAGGTPFEFNTIAVCDGIAMGHEGMRYSLPSRELIADSVEIMMQAHRLDGMVTISNCDKITPGMLMAAARINVPAISVTGGPMESGILEGQKVGVNNVFEAVGKVFAGKMTPAESADAGKRSLSRMRQLQRHVHSQHHGVHDRSYRYVSSLLRNSPRKWRVETENRQRVWRKNHCSW